MLAYFWLVRSRARCNGVELHVVANQSTTALLACLPEMHIDDATAWQAACSLGKLSGASVVRQPQGAVRWMVQLSTPLVFDTDRLTAFLTAYTQDQNLRLQQCVCVAHPSKSIF